MTPADFLDQAFVNSTDPMWGRIIGEGADAAALGQSVPPETYAAVFTTPAGREVLEDMIRRYVMVTRAVPGEGADAAFYREGMAQVALDIVNQVSIGQGVDDV